MCHENFVQDDFDDGMDMDNEECKMALFMEMLTRLTGASMNLCTRAALLTLTSFTLHI